MGAVLKEAGFPEKSLIESVCFSPPLGGVVMLKVRCIGAFAKNHRRTVAFGTGTF